ncbi:MAG: 4Fe-4S binding protein [Anaerolineales bacterium]|nr:4Fe-4S binding protein [Anaerolineales bacterium]
MEMRVNTGQCTGCGACIEVCPTGAIHLSRDIAVIDQPACTQCEACMDVCPVGAITRVELPVPTKALEVIQPAHKAEIVVVEPVHPDHKPWLAAALSFAGREILPWLADTLIAALDRRLAQAQPVHSQNYSPMRDAAMPPTLGRGRCYRRRGRGGWGRQQRRE